MWLSPYNAFDNNPVYWTDPSGADATSYINFLWNITPQGTSAQYGDTSNSSNESNEQSDGDYYDSVTGEKVYNDGKNDGLVYVRTRFAYGYGYSDKLIGDKSKIPDKTKAFLQTLIQTNKFFSKMNNYYLNKERAIGAGWIGKYYTRLKYFASQVGNNKPYDIKRNNKTEFYTGAGNNNFFNNYAFFDGKLFRSDDFGNFNYGVAGKAFGFSSIELQASAGANQVGNYFKYDSPVGGFKSFFDDDKDNYMIIQGMNYYLLNFND